MPYLALPIVSREGCALPHDLEDAELALSVSETDLVGYHGVGGVAAAMVNLYPVPNPTPPLAQGDPLGRIPKRTTHILDPSGDPTRIP